MLILEYDSTDIVPGGAGNAANNVAALGGAATLVALVGRDDAGRRLLAAFPRGVDTPARGAAGRLPHAGQDAHPRRRHPLGEAAGGAHRSRTRGRRSPTPGGRRGCAPRRRRAARRRRRARLGLRLRPRVTRARVDRCVGPLRTGRRPVPVLVDSRYDLLRYRGLTACTPNESEVEQALGVDASATTRGRSNAPAARMLARTAHGRGARHARQPRHGALRARRAHRAHPDLRLRRDRRRHRRRRHRDGDADARAGRRRHVRPRRRGWPTTPAGSW